MGRTNYLMAIAFIFAFSSCQQQRSTTKLPEESAYEDSVLVVDSIDVIESENESSETNTENTSRESSNSGPARICQECFAARDGHFDDLNKYSNRKDEDAIREGIAAGIFTILQPSSCTVVDREFGKKKVRVSGTEWWVSSEFVSE